MRLNTYVHVHRVDGPTVVFGPDDELPDWAVKEITNPAVWAGGDATSDDDMSEAEFDAAFTAGEPVEIKAAQVLSGVDDQEPSKPKPVRRGRPRKTT